jgi:hypothetical protein
MAATIWLSVNRVFFIVCIFKVRELLNFQTNELRGTLHVAYKRSSRHGYAGRYQSSYRRSSAAYYTGHRSVQRWDKVKVKRKKDKLVYKFKKDD